VCFAVMGRWPVHQSRRSAPASKDDHAAAEPAIADCAKLDWASDRFTLAGLWGVPATVMLFALLLEPAPRAVVWVAMLTWMGCARILNARRCGRTHCRYTGPFFLGMAVLVTVHAAGMVSLGNQPWLLLGIVIGAGNAFIWWSTERILGPIQGDTHGGQREDLAARAAVAPGRSQPLCSASWQTVPRLTDPTRPSLQVIGDLAEPTGLGQACCEFLRIA
jgi:hypothetical protein